MVIVIQLHSVIIRSSKIRLFCMALSLNSCIEIPRYVQNDMRLSTNKRENYHAMKTQSCQQHQTVCNKCANSNFINKTKFNIFSNCTYSKQLYKLTMSEKIPKPIETTPKKPPANINATLIPKEWHTTLDKELRIHMIKQM